MLGSMVTEDGVSFGVWAPKAARVEVEIETGDGVVHHPLEQDEKGVHRGVVAGIGAGARYRFRLDGGGAFPDPRSRFQPEGVHGPAEVVDPRAFVWTDQQWPGITRDGQVIYELHVGTYTAEGTYEALREQLPELADLGVTAIELLPVAEFPGRWNWGYDGVDWFAPSRAYGAPDDLRRLIDAAHGLGLAVLLDVVYNHFGPDGNYLRAMSDDYFTARHMTAWGEGINYDGENSSFARDLVLDNVRHWIDEYHFDGLRLDATDAIVDDSPVHILREIGVAARDATKRDVVIIAEDARNEVRIVRRIDQGGYGLDAVWADDFHHALRVYLTNARENYYAMYDGSLADIAIAINEGFIYQGQVASTTGEPRGTAVTVEPASAFIFCIQNHDQIGNRPFGDRIHHDIEGGRFATATTLLLLSPETPLIFMGQEFAASTPFLFFTDHEGELGRLVTEGRRKEFGGFRVFNHAEHREFVPDPQAEETFLRSKLKLAEREEHAGVYALYRELLRIRRDDPVLATNDRSTTLAETVGVNAVAMRRWRGDQQRLLIANFGDVMSYPLGESSGRAWRKCFTTSDTAFGGSGKAPEIGDGLITVPARTAALFTAG